MKTFHVAVRVRRTIVAFCSFVGAMLIAGCSNYSSSGNQPVTIQISLATASVQTGQTQQFSATVTYATNTAVTWQVNDITGGNPTVGTISASGLYTAPAAVPNPATVTVKAIAQADTTKTSTATVTVTAPPAITVTVSPKTPTVQVSLTQQFTATVANTSNTAVIWQVNGVPGGNSTVGTISASGLYTAPAAVPSGAVTVKAISQADSAKSDTATVTIVLPITVTVSPKTPSVQASKTQQFTATVANTSNTAVTWQVNNVTGGNSTVGTISASGLYTAPAAVPNPATVTVKAISQADNTKSDTATVTITPPVTVTVSPKTPSVVTSLTQQFTATVANSSNTAVTWQVNNVTGGNSTAGTISASGLYTAPASVPNPATVTVKAISQADNTKSDTATVTIVLPVSVAVSPKTISVQVALTQQFAATVANTSNTAVTWQVNNVTGGSATTGTISATGLFTAPVTVPGTNPVTVKAISQADNTKSDTATVTITAASSVTVAITPKRGGLTLGQTMTFTPTVTGTSNTAVTWEVDGVTGGSSSAGLITTSGIYTAPNSGGIHNIVARSQADITAASPASPIGVTDLAGVYTYHNDASRTGQNTHEFALTTANVKTATFGKVFSCPVDSYIYAQPLWVANVNISGTKHNVVYVVTTRNTVYAFDADSSSCTNVWGGPVSLLGSNETWLTIADESGCDDIPEIGIVGTPVIEPATNTMYLVTRTKNNAATAFFQRLHALDLATGAEEFSGPTNIQATASGNGAGSVAGVLTFDAQIHNQRPALLLTGAAPNGHVIISWASHCDFGQYHGWVMSYSASTLAQEAVINVSPNGVLNGIWMSGAGPAADASGNIYLVTGNGTFDSSNANYGDAIVKLSPPSAGTFSVASFFAPNDQANLEATDADLGSGGLLLLPDVSSTPNQLLVQAGKDSRIFLANRSSLGGNGSANNVTQELDGALPEGVWGMPAYWNKNVYFGVAGPLRAYSFDASGTGRLSASPTSQTGVLFGYPGPTPSVSSNGASNGILWALDNSDYTATSTCPTVCQTVFAYDATNLGTKLWDSLQAASNRDRPGGVVKFAVPTVANGKVYVGGQGVLTVYGLLPN